MRLAAAAGLIVGLIATGVTASVLDRDGGPDGEPASDLLAAWRRSREATWVVTWRYERHVVGATQPVVLELRTAQRPPDRLELGPGSIEARRGTRALVCTTGRDDALVCGDDGRAPPYADEVDAEVTNLATLVAGPGRHYDVRRDRDGCFVLHLRVRIPAPVFGEDARYCFDDDTAAPRLVEWHKVEALERWVAEELSGAVTDADLAPPPQGGGAEEVEAE